MFRSCSPAASNSFGSRSSLAFAASTAAVSLSRTRIWRASSASQLTASFCSSRADFARATRRSQLSSGVGANSAWHANPSNRSFRSKAVKLLLRARLHSTTARSHFLSFGGSFAATGFRKKLRRFLRYRSISFRYVRHFSSSTIFSDATFFALSTSAILVVVFFACRSAAAHSGELPAPPAPLPHAACRAGVTAIASVFFSAVTVSGKTFFSYPCRASVASPSAAAWITFEKRPIAEFSSHMARSATCRFARLAS
mmetsp:Transcript_2537/g.5899  ORF Transcript_2537/g.5899 Transcript_2537/m.5899 type:complete len:255 (-) Transcript_2537:1081-1845(-)